MVGKLQTLVEEHEHLKRILDEERCNYKKALHTATDLNELQEICIRISELETLLSNMSNEIHKLS